MFVYIRARFHSALIGGNLTAQTTGHRRIGGGIVVANSPSFSCPAARAPRRACLQAKENKKRQEKKPQLVGQHFYSHLKYSVENWLKQISLLGEKWQKNKTLN